LFAFPQMAAVQLMCSRLGMITGRRRYSRWVLWGACLLLTVANVINIGADLGGMADAMHMMTGISALWWMPAFAAFLVAMLLWTSYRVIARTFNWLTAVLFAYLISAFLVKPDWTDRDGNAGRPRTGGIECIRDFPGRWRGAPWGSITPG
jgi:Mn2+/Fe2+ NRAMP family transporter